MAPRSRWTSTGDLTVGSSGMGTLNINGGLAEVSQDTFVGRFGLQAMEPSTSTTARSQPADCWHALAIWSGAGTINTNGLVTDIDLIFDQTNGLQRQFTLNSQPDQNILLNLAATSAGWLGAASAVRDTYDRRRRDGRVQEWLSRLSFRRNR